MIWTTISIAVLFGVADDLPGSSSFTARLAEPREPAPPLDLLKVLQAPDGAEWTWDSLRGNVVVLEFWHTRCGPCVEVLPHLAKLKKQFANEPVIFISITPEDQGTVSRFIEHHVVPGWIGLANGDKTEKSYGIREIPEAVVVDKNGIVLGWIDPRALVESPDLLRAVIRDEKILLQQIPPIERKDHDPRTSSDQDEETVCEVRIERPSLQRNFLSRDAYSSENSTVRNAICGALDVTPPYIEWVAPDDASRYDISIRGCGRGRMAALRILRTVLEETFRLRITRTEKVKDVYVLNTCRSQRPFWEPAMSRLSIDAEKGLVAPTQEVLERMKRGEKFFMALGSSSNLAAHLSYAVKRPVIDEAKIDGYYHFYFPMDVEDDPAEKAIQGVKDKYGLCMVPDRRTVEVYVIESADPSSSPGNP